VNPSIHKKINDLFTVLQIFALEAFSFHTSFFPLTLLMNTAGMSSACGVGVG
jgi:hypothetical protein